MLQNQYRRVVALLLVLFTIGSTNIPGPSTAHAQTSDIIVKDKDDPNVEWGGTPGYFYDAGPGSVVASGHAMWTGSNANSPDNFVKWKPPLPECGIYEVFAYIPWIENGKADTTNAVYKIRHRGNETTRAVNMRAVNDGFGRSRTDRWHSLGTYVFSKDANSVGEYVLLGDTTGESGIQSVNFDDMRWVKQPGGGAVCAALPPPPPPVDGIIVKDKDDPNVEWGGTPGYFYDAGPGSVVANGHAMWTGSNANSPDNFVKWKPPLPECGTYEVFAYIPWIENGRADTTNAVYKIRYRGGETTKAVNMRAINDGFGSSRTDRWYSLGTYLFSKDANSLGEHVLLGDTTGESGIQSVNFDDMRWVKRVGGGAVCAALPPPPPPAVDGIIVKDKDDPNVERGGTPGYFYDAGPGSVVASGHAMWTGSNANSPDNFVKWKPPLPECGIYEVFAYIPWIENGKADTTNAVYKIRHRSGGTSAGANATRSLNMNLISAQFGATTTDRWVSLGSYLWSANAGSTGEYVLLGDSTGEGGIQSVNFDDMRWVYRGPNSACSAPPTGGNNDTSAPTGYVSAPGNNTTIRPGVVSFTAEAFDSGSGVNRVEFYLFYDNTWHLVGTDTNAPYAVNWQTPSNFTSQQLRFTIHIIDNVGNRAVDPGGYHYVTYSSGASRPVAVFVHGWQGADIKDPDGIKFECQSKANGPYTADPPDEFNLLAKELIKNGYIVYFARWRTGWAYTMKAEDAARMCLFPEIQQIKQDQHAQGNPITNVTLVAHSMGGLVSRAYIEGADYQGDVNRLITFGTPHAGINGLSVLLTWLNLLKNSGGRYGDQYCAGDPGTCQLSSTGMAEFANVFQPSKLPPHRKVPYHFVGGGQGLRGHPLATLMRVTDGVNDAVVSRKSATGYDGGNGPVVYGTQIERVQTNDAHQRELRGGSHAGYEDSEASVKCLRRFLSLPGDQSCSSFSANESIAADATQTTSLSRTRVEGGTIQANERRTFPLWLDGKTAEILVGWTDGDVDVTLTAPDGTVITPTNVGTHVSGGSYDEQMSQEWPSTAEYLLPNFTPGAWQVTVQATTTTRIALSSQLDSPLQLQAEPPSSVAPDERFTVTARLGSVSTAIPGSTVRVTLEVGNGTPVDMYEVTSGVYTAQLTAPKEAGQYQLNITAVGSSAQPFTRQQNYMITVRSNDVQRSGTVQIKAIDTNGNDRFDLLGVNVPVTVQRATTYVVEATLHAADGTIITQTHAEPILGLGTQTLALEFDGRAVNRSRANGVYTIQLRVVSGDQIQLCVDERPLTQTSPYTWGQFEEGAVKAYLPFTRR